EELGGSQNPDHRLLVPLGQDREFDLAFLNVKDRIGGVALREHVFILFKFKDRLARAHFGEKVPSAKHDRSRLPHPNLPLAQAKLTSGGSVTLSVTGIGRG